ncbi:hypothetical protein BC828DRAFT_406118 [Blastocladiella britannica]|nr:hypothetical protein BC828DRAFT_406118 [Blastocladiella britannica]
MLSHNHSGSASGAAAAAPPPKRRFNEHHPATAPAVVRSDLGQRRLPRVHSHNVIPPEPHRSSVLRLGTAPQHRQVHVPYRPLFTTTHPPNVALDMTHERDTEYSHLGVTRRAGVPGQERILEPSLVNGPRVLGQRRTDLMPPTPPPMFQREQQAQKQQGQQRGGGPRSFFDLLDHRQHDSRPKSNGALGSHLHPSASPSLWLSGELRTPLDKELELRRPTVHKRMPIGSHNDKSNSHDVIQPQRGSPAELSNSDPSRYATTFARVHGDLGAGPLVAKAAQLDP